MLTRFYLRVLATGDAKTWWFEAASRCTIKIGGSAQNQVILADPLVSRLHAVIALTSKGAALRAIAGVRVNGEVTSNRDLRAGDVLEIGGTRLEVGWGAGDVVAGADAAAAIAGAAGAGDVATSPRVTSAPSLFADEPAAERPLHADLDRARAFAAVAEKSMSSALPAEPPCTSDNCLVEVRCFLGTALLGMWHFRQPAQITLGETAASTIFLSSEGLPCDEFPLVRFRDGAYVLSIIPTMRGEILQGGEIVSLPLASSALGRGDAPLASVTEIALSLDSQVLIHWGGVSLALRFCVQPSIERGNRWSHLDFDYMNSFVVAFFFHIAFIVTLLLSPKDVKALQVDPFSDPGRMATLILSPPPPTQHAQKILQEFHEHLPQPPTPKPSGAPKQPPVKHPPTTPPRGLGSWPAPNQASSRPAGMGAMRDFLLRSGAQLQSGDPGHSLSSVTLSPLAHDSPTLETHGLDISGVPSIGNSRTIGPISTGHGLGERNFEPSLGKPASDRVDILTPGTPDVQGALPADVIKHVVDAQRAQVRYCYERELQRRHDLEGRVVIGWTIGATGHVFNAHIVESSLGDPGVEACLLERVRSWIFPPPAGGGTVEVHYPFVFHAS